MGDWLAEPGQGEQSDGATTEDLKVYLQDGPGTLLEAWNAREGEQDGCMKGCDGATWDKLDHPSLHFGTSLHMLRHSVSALQVSTFKQDHNRICVPTLP